MLVCFEERLDIKDKPGMEKLKVQSRDIWDKLNQELRSEMNALSSRGTIARVRL